MTINVTEQQGVHVLEVSGRLDGDSAPALGREMDGIIAANNYRLVLDLGDVDYVSSAGLREIVRVYKIVQDKAGDLRIANPSDRVMDVMALAGLDTMLHIYQTRHQAIDDF